MATQPRKINVLKNLCNDHVLTHDNNVITRVLQTDISDHFEVLHATNFFVETKTAKKTDINVP